MIAAKPDRVQDWGQIVKSGFGCRDTVLPLDTGLVTLEMHQS